MQPFPHGTVPYHLYPVFTHQTPAIYHPAPPSYSQVHPCPPTYPPPWWLGLSQPQNESHPQSTSNTHSPRVPLAGQSKQALFKVDDYWKGKISGPLPGFTSQNHFAPVILCADPDPTVSSDSPTNADTRPKFKLLPPLSHSESPSSPSIITVCLSHTAV
jgi:hypothetical protein